jgi:hypothetical protein
MVPSYDSLAPWLLRASQMASAVSDKGMQYWDREPCISEQQATKASIFTLAQGQIRWTQTGGVPGNPFQSSMTILYPVV